MHIPPGDALSNNHGDAIKKLTGILGEFSLIVAIVLSLLIGLFLLLKNPWKTGGTDFPYTCGQSSSCYSGRTGSEHPGMGGRVLPGAFSSILVVYSGCAIAEILFRGNTLAKPFEKARRNILDGMDLTEVILRCYQEMGQILQQEGGIERQVYTTPTEFEAQLNAAGLPRAPVHELTQLFEHVRYGRFTPTHDDEQEALSNLHKIITHLRKINAARNNE